MPHVKYKFKGVVKKYSGGMIAIESHHDGQFRFLILSNSFMWGDQKDIINSCNDRMIEIGFTATTYTIVKTHDVHTSEIEFEYFESLSYINPFDNRGIINYDTTVKT